MSLALQSVTPVTVQDPKIVQQDRIYPVLKGGSEVLYKKYISTNVSSSTIGWHAPPPNSHLYVDRCIQALIPVRVKLTACASGATAIGAVINLQPNYFAIRSWPIQRALESITMTINTQTMSVNIGDVISCFEHFNISAKAKAIDKSKTATYPCGMSQNFSDLAYTGAVAPNTARNPLAGQDSVAYQGVNKGMPFTIVGGTNVVNSGSPVQLPAAGVIIDFLSCETLFLSPLYFGDACYNDSAFFGVTGMDITMNFVGNAANRMIAIDGVSSGAWPTGSGVAGLAAAEQLARSSIMSVQWAFNAVGWAGFQSVASPFSYSVSSPTLLITYITPQLVDRGSAMQKILNYPMYTVIRYPTDYSQMAGVTFSGNAEVATAQPMTSTNVQLNTIPSKLYVFARQNNQGLQQNPYSPDCFLRLVDGSLNMQWGARGGLLATASLQQLYDISVNAGCTLSYADWACQGQTCEQLAAGATGWATNVAGGKYYGVGTVFGLDPVDLGLDSVDAPGKLDQLTVQVQASYQNLSSAQVTPTFYVVALSPGLFTLFNGQASSLIGVLNSNDILNSHKNSESQFHSYQATREIYGGNFMSDIKSDLKHLRKKVKPMEMAGGTMSGAARVSRTALKDRLM